MRQDLLPKTYNGILSRLMEESAEVIVACAKLQRFGGTATDPITQIRYDNVRDLQAELVDLKHAINEFEKLYD